jgi:hypothetical protein
MSFQQAIHLSLSITLYHSTISFQFINAYEENDRTFFLLPQKILNKLSPNSTNIHCKSLIEKYKTPNQSLNHFFKKKLLLITILKFQKIKIKLYIGYHLIFIKIQKIIIKKILVLSKPFHGLENNFKKQHLSWKDVYFNVEDNIEKNEKINFFIILIF